MKRIHTATFSIVAIDYASGLMAVGGTSCWFAYGTLVPFIESGVGAVATQAECNLAYGPDGLRLLGQQQSSDRVIEQLVNEDEQKDIRQVLTLDVDGRVAAYTGRRCVEVACDYVGEGFAIAGNMMANDRIVPAMKEFYTTSTLPFVEKVIKTLQAGQEAGGDVRGKQSAALLVAEIKPSGDYWKGMVYNLRVDDHPEPLEELRRHYDIATAFIEMGKGDTAYFEDMKPEEAMEHYRKAMELAPDNPQSAFWYAKLLYDMGERTQAKEIIDDLSKKDQRWADYWQRVLATNN
jgi:uncharacterized Ntn-hydrolase superfamily protein